MSDTDDHVGMGTRERPIDRGRRRARHLRLDIGRELRECRLAAGLSQAALAHAAGVDPGTVGKIERAEVIGVSVQRLTELFAAVGHDLGVRAYPFGPPLRDAAHVALLRRVKARVGDAWRWHYEVPIGPSLDPRAWDAVLERGEHRVGLEAETRLRDVQALLRRLEAKRRDSGIPSLVLVLADTRANRAAVRATGELLRASFPQSATATWAALRRGAEPGGDALLFA